MKSIGVVGVLNLIITGIPSILNNKAYNLPLIYRFKPYYNWNTFNTMASINELEELIEF